MKTTECIKHIQEGTSYIDEHKEHFLEIFIIYTEEHFTDDTFSDAAKNYFDIFIQIFITLQLLVKHQKIDDKEVIKNIKKILEIFNFMLKNVKMKAHYKVDVMSAVVYMKTFQKIFVSGLFNDLLKSSSSINSYHSSSPTNSTSECHIIDISENNVNVVRSSDGKILTTPSRISGSGSAVSKQSKSSTGIMLTSGMNNNSYKPNKKNNMLSSVSKLNNQSSSSEDSGENYDLFDVDEILTAPKTNLIKPRKNNIGISDELEKSPTDDYIRQAMKKYQEPFTANESDADPSDFSPYKSDNPEDYIKRHKEKKSGYHHIKQPVKETAKETTTSMFQSTKDSLYENQNDKYDQSYNHKDRKDHNKTNKDHKDHKDHNKTNKDHNKTNKDHNKTNKDQNKTNKDVHKHIDVQESCSESSDDSYISDSIIDPHPNSSTEHYRHKRYHESHHHHHHYYHHDSSGNNQDTSGGTTNRGITVGSGTTNGGTTNRGITVGSGTTNGGTTNSNGITNSNGTTNSGITSNITNSTTDSSGITILTGVGSTTLVVNNSIISIDQILKIYSFQILKQIQSIDYVINTSIKILSEIKRDFVTKINCLEMYSTTSKLDLAEVEYHNNIINTMYNQLSIVLLQTDSNGNQIFNNVNQTISVTIDLGSGGTYTLFTIDNIFAQYTSTQVDVIIGKGDYILSFFKNTVLVSDAIAIYKTSFYNIKNAIFALNANKNIVTHWNDVVKNCHCK
jgi:hypothetical protein